MGNDGVRAWVGAGVAGFVPEVDAWEVGVDAAGIGEEDGDGH
jgi:hypothetical protein